jgi:hypothetical protein
VQPLLSVVVPTKNRMKYVLHTIASILSIEDQEMELLICDNSDSDELKIWISMNVSDSRLRYRYISDPLSMTDNYNAAMGMATGYYVCTIGDDDAVSPEIMSAARWARSKGIDALSSQSNSGLVYFWPDFFSKTRGAGLAGKLYIESFTGATRKIDVEAELVKCISNAGQGSLGLPRVYHGIVRRDCLVQLFLASGTYFKGVSPDVYGAISVSAFLQNAWTIDYPLTISGNSGGSNAGRAAKGTHKGSLEEDPHMKPYRNLNWPIGVPEFFCVESVWGSASIEALNTLGRRDLLSLYDYALLHSMCVIRHPDYLKQTLKSFNNLLAIQHANVPKAYLRLARGMAIVAYRFGRRVLARVFPKKFKLPRKEISDLENINQAGQWVSKVLNKRGSPVEFS